MADDRKPVAVEPWQVLETRYSYRDRWLALRSDTVRVPNGTILSPYHTIEFPEWICAVALTSDHHIVLIEEYRHGVGRLSIELPCGTPDHDGEDLLAAMQRELLEETGYAADEWHALGSSTANTARQNNRVHAFLALDARPRHLEQLWIDSGGKLRVLDFPIGECPAQKLEPRALLAAIARAIGAAGRPAGGSEALRAVLREIADPASRLASVADIALELRAAAGTKRAGWPGLRWPWRRK